LSDGASVIAEYLSRVPVQGISEYAEILGPRQNWGVHPRDWDASAKMYPSAEGLPQHPIYIPWIEFAALCDPRLGKGEKDKVVPMLN
jgi:hypothetical protein